MSVSTYKILSITQLGGVKTGMTVTFVDEVNGKPDITFYHEVESTDDAVIAEQLAAVAMEYESRVPVVVVASKLKLDVAVKAVKGAKVVKAEAEVVGEVTIVE